MKRQRAHRLVFVLAFLGTSFAVFGGIALANHSLYQQISEGEINGNGSFDASFDGVSSDGTHAFFRTAEKLVSTDTDSAFDLYERSGGSTKRVSAGQINGNGAFDAHFAGSSSDGTRVFFTTFERLVSTDTDGAGDVYERSSGSTKHVSAGQINGNANFIVSFSRASADGTRVLFTTLEQLVPGDTDGSEDVYERSGGTTSRISRGNGSFPALFAGGSADGSAVFFITVERVFADDVDLSVDIYGAYIAP